MPDLKRKAAQMIADIMMSHYDGPFDDSAFYDELIDEEVPGKMEPAEYFDENKRELYDNREFREMVVDAVRDNLLPK